MNGIRQGGTALVTALLVVALASVAATGLLERQRIDIRRTANLLTLDQAFAYARAAESWAVAVLRRDATENRHDSRLDKWAALFEPIPIDDGSLTAQVVDQQALFNLNNLVDASGKPSQKDIAAFERLLAALELDTTLAGAVLDWIDADSNVATHGAEDNDYLRRDVPYRAANRAMAAVSELRQVRGIESEVYDKLAAYVTALPERTTVNVNTAPVPVLMAVVKGLSTSAAATILATREVTPYEDENAFRGQQALEGLQVDGIGVSSDYFLIESRVRLGRSRIVHNTLVKRGATTGDQPGVIEILARSRGGLS
ncbi:MAG: type II secretion system minor pseudopilin GspK [Granulosicoccaceae bacterium]|jgi:general secretion pathway protein K